MSRKSARGSADNPRMEGGRYSDSFLFEILSDFINERKVTAIAQTRDLSREQVYPLISRAFRQGLARLVPPLDESLRDQIVELYGLPPDAIHVVDVSTPGSKEEIDKLHALGLSTSAEHVSTVAADIALDCLKKINREAGLEGRRPVGVAVSPGRATLDWARSFAQLANRSSDCPKLKIFALAASCPPTEPEFAASAFFGLFNRNVVENFLDLPCEPILSQRNFMKRRQNSKFMELAFKEVEKDHVDMIVTAMGNLEDEHDLLRSFLETSGVSYKTLVDKGWIGSVGYLPFTGHGPVVHQDEEMRAVSLMELDDIVKFAEKKHKHTLLIARCCSKCGKDKARALAPLLREPSLRVWNEIVMDRKTAQALIKNC